MNLIPSSSCALGTPLYQPRPDRQPVNLAARLVWKDARGTTRFNTVVIRDVSETGAYVENMGGAVIPLYRLVTLQAERTQVTGERLPAVLRQGKLLSAVYRVAPARPATGTPEGYALRLLVEPHRRQMAALASA